MSIGQVEMPATQKLRIATIAPGALTEVRTIFQTTTTTELNAPRVSNLFTVRPDGSGLRQLTHSTTSTDRATQAHFTPDGRIIYTRVTPIGRTLWLINADGRNGEPIPARGERIRTHGDWQPNHKLRTRVSGDR